jgi:hypothetical protein
MSKSPGRRFADQQPRGGVEALLRKRGMSGVPEKIPGYDPVAGVAAQGGDATRPRCPVGAHRARHQPNLPAGEDRAPFANLRRDK